MPYTVSVSSTYRVGCPICTMDAERLAVQGIRDTQVTSLTLRAVAKCEHPDAPGAAAGGALAGQAMLPGLAQLPASDVNGFDPEERL
jgi:hypothetical protein